MASQILKYSTLKNLKDIDYTFGNVKKNELENCARQVSEESLQYKEAIRSLYFQCKKEYLKRIKNEEEIETLSQQQIVASQKCSRLQAKLQSLKNEKENHGKREVQKGVVAYECILGMSIELSNDESSSHDILFTFNNINGMKPQETCSFVLSLTDHNKYEVMKCSPPLDGMEELVLKLNKTNNLHDFVANVRKEFCKLVSKQVY